MDGPRPPNPAEYSRILDFLNRNLRGQQNWSIANEYPTALGETNLGNIRIIKENDEILSHAVLRPLLVKSALGIFKVAAIGSVVTAPDYRNHGLSRRIVEDCLNASRAQGCDFAILWTNLYEFYRKFDFELAGSEISFVIDKDLPVTSSEFRFVEGPAVDPEPLLRLFSQHTVSTIRTFDETRRYLQIPNSRVFTAWDSTGNLRAYAIEGKGADLQGYVHEWGGGVSALIPLLQYMRTSLKKPLTIIVPAHAQNLRTQLSQYGVKEVSGFLGMIKILNAPSLFGKILRFARTDLGISEFVFEQRQNKYYFGVGKNLFCTDSEQDIIKLMFGPLTPNEIHKFDPATAEVMNKIFPIPMWIWGWDSV
ncbi:MAG: GNAT family N-acetyltransferase [Bdellovibrionia bacterium]